MWMLMALTPSLADPPAGGITLRPCEWINTESGPGLLIYDAEGMEVEVSLRVAFGELKTTWSLAPTKMSLDAETILLDVPEAAVLHPLASTYVSDLLATVTIGSSTYLEKAVLAWPDGTKSKPVVWSHAEQEIYAPQGVLDSGLRQDSLDAGHRLMPDVSDALALPANPAKGPEGDEP